MSYFILIPTEIQGILLDKKINVSKPDADFQKLPWKSADGKENNKENASLSSTIATQRFDVATDVMDKGVYLHWHLPHCFTTPSKTDSDKNYPAVPNLWLVLRFRKKVLEKKWLVQSDYMDDQSSTGLSDQCIVPIPYDLQNQPNRKPYKFLGRKNEIQNFSDIASLLGGMTPSNQWKTYYGKGQTDALTNIGYGNPFFSSYYPNCKGVFGFYDEEIDSFTNNDDIQYLVLGLYEDVLNDPIYQYCEKPRTMEEIEERFHFFYNTAKGTPPSVLDYSKSLCYGLFNLTTSNFEHPNDKTIDLNWAVGNNITEAISSYLAKKIVEKTPTYKEKIVEEQLHSMIFDPELSQNTANLLSAFQQISHTHEFIHHWGGVEWKIETRNISKEKTKQSDKQSVFEYSMLPDNSDFNQLLDDLNNLNVAQQQYEDLEYQIDATKEQLFSDWYKLVEVNYNIGVFSAKPITRGSIDYSQYISTSSLENLQQNLQNKSDEIQGHMTNITGLIQKINQEIEILGADFSLQLKEVPKPNYWSPHEPVLLVEGLPIDSDKQKGKDTTDIDYFESGAGSLGVASDVVINDLYNKISNYSKGSAGISETLSDWNPFIMEWEADFTPVEMKDPKGDYYKEGVTRSFYLEEGSSEFDIGNKLADATKLSATNFTLSSHPETLSGKTVLSPFHSVTFKYQLALFLRKGLGIEIPQGTKPADFITKVKTAVDKIAKKTPSKLTAVQSIAWEAWGLLDASNILAQNLEGFNMAMLMKDPELQMQIADPFGNNSQQNTTQEIAEKLQGATTLLSPMITAQFLPVRAGVLEMKRIRLKDNFGVFRDFERDASGLYAYAKHLKQYEVKPPPSHPFLMPRIMTPMRLNSGWISSTNPQHRATNIIPTNPVHGWLMVDELNSSLLVYSKEGYCLGILDKDKKWIAAPTGSKSLVSGSSKKIDKISEIPDVHLQKVVQSIQKSDNTIASFVTDINYALMNIAPSNESANQALSLLVSRPMAITRISFGIEQKGTNAINQSWEAYINYYKGGTRDKAYENVEFPIRLGDSNDTENGLVAYWRERTVESNPNDYVLDPVVFGQKVEEENSSAHPNRTLKDYTFLCSQTSPDEKVTLLMDPLGTVNIYSGFLPTHELTIPKEWVAEVTNNISPLLRFGPILNVTNDKKALYIPHPKEKGYSWEWYASLEDDAPSDSVLQPPTNPLLQKQNQLQSGYIKLKPTPKKNTD